MKNSIGLKKGDLLIILLFSALSVLLFLLPLFSGSDGCFAVVYKDGERQTEIDLSAVEKGYELEVNGCVLSVEKGKISFLSSTCPDKLCEKSGYLSKNGDTAACLPNKVVVRIESKKEKGNFDAVAS